MNVREFVKESLLAIVGGVVDAQKEIAEIAPDAKISPAYARHEPGAAVAAGRQQSVTMIEFDLAVTVTHTGHAEASGSAKAGVLSVFSASADAGAEYSHERSNVSRLRFDVPIVMPRQEVPKDGKVNGAPIPVYVPRRQNWLYPER